MEPGDAAVRQQGRRLLHLSGGPLVVAGDEIAGGQGREPFQQRAQVRRVRPLVHEIPHQSDDVRVGGLHRRRQAAVVPAEPAAMEVRQHHQPSAVPARGQTGGGKCVFLDGEGVVPPPESGSGQGQGRQQQRQGLLSAFFLVGHGGTSFPAVTYYIIGSPGFASPLLCIIAKNDERFL